MTRELPLLFLGVVLVLMGLGCQRHSLLNPTFVAASAASFLHELDMVLGIELNGEARAFPIKIRTKH